MVLWVHRDGACLVEDGTKNRLGDDYFLIDFIDEMIKTEPKLNGPMRTL